MGKKVKNPCKGRCYDYDFKKEYCRGCGLTLKEREKWFFLSDADRKKILERIAKSSGRGPSEKT